MPGTLTENKKVVCQGPRCGRKGVTIFWVNFQPRMMNKFWTDSNDRCSTMSISLMLGKYWKTAKITKFIMCYNILNLVILIQRYLYSINSIIHFIFLNFCFFNYSFYCCLVGWFCLCFVFFFEAESHSVGLTVLELM